MLTYVLAQIEQTDDQTFMIELYENYKYIMFATAKKYVADTETMEDLVQDSLVKLIPKLGTLRRLEPNARISYVVYTVRNTAINHLRRKSVENRYFVDESDESIPHSISAFREVEDLVESSDRTKAFCRMLDMIPERDQLALRGRYYLQMTDDELAELLECKPGSVRVMLTRARRRLLELLQKEGFDYDIS